MSQIPLMRTIPTLLCGVAAPLLLGPPPALACYVCFGEPNSAMVQGVFAGITVLLGAIGLVLTGLVALVIFWIHRAANLERRSSAERPVDLETLQNAGESQG